MPKPIIKTVTDALIAGMEEAESLELVIVVGQTKEGEMLICTSPGDVAAVVGLLENAKLSLVLQEERED